MENTIIKKPELYLCVGRKTNERTAYLKNKYTDSVRINPGNYRYPTEEEAALKFAKGNKEDVVIDWTCHTQSTRKFYIDLFKDSYKICVLDFGAEYKSNVSNNRISVACGEVLNFEPIQLNEENINQLSYPSLIDFSDKRPGRKAVFFNLSRLDKDTYKNTIMQYIKEGFISIGFVDMLSFYKEKKDYDEFRRVIGRLIAGFECQIDEIVFPVITYADMGLATNTGVSNALYSQLKKAKEKYNLSVHNIIMYGDPYPHLDWVVGQDLNVNYENIKIK